MLQNLDRTSLITGAALALTANVLFPVAKGTLRSLTTLGVRGIVGLTEAAKSTACYAREELEDIIAEAQFERMKKQMDAEIEMDRGAVDNGSVTAKQ